MARRKRETNVYSMSFLDIMACGFGAIILFFVIIQHATEDRTDDLTADLSGEVNRLETEVALEELNRAKLQQSIDEIEQEIVTSQAEADRMLEEVTDSQDALTEQEQETAARREHFNQLVTDIQAIEERLKEIQAEQELGGEDVRNFYGSGDRQYLTGVNVGGQRIMILLDASASMLDETIVNIIRRRHLPDRQKRRADKWQRALLTVEWITTQFPETSEFQIYTFNTRADPVLKDTRGEWLKVDQGRLLDNAVDALRERVPENGTRLHAVVEAINDMNPLPDNIFLIIDSLPTQGESPPRGPGTVDSRRRQRFFDDAVRELPRGVPINVVLFPMEGDPLASSEYWKLAVRTGGSFMSPSKDWP